MKRWFTAAFAALIVGGAGVAAAQPGPDSGRADQTGTSDSTETSTDAARSDSDNADPQNATPATSPHREPLPAAPLLVVDMPGCTEGSAYSFDAGGTPQPGAPYAWFHNPSEEFRGGVAALTFASEALSSDDLADPSISSHVTEFPDGAAVIEWRNDRTHVALLSAKRMAVERLEQLAEAIVSDAVEEAGFEQLNVPDTPAHVTGHSCSLDSAFVGVEVVSGDTAAQLAYIGTTDPSDVEVHDGYSIVTFNRIDGGPVRLASVTPQRWQSTVAATPADGPTR